MKVLGAIIAGGSSSRMAGAEKAFLMFGGVPMIERVISRIGFQVDDVVINANGDPTRFSRFGKRIVPDRLATVHSPLAGLHAVLLEGREKGFDAVLTVPSDTPFLPLDLVPQLAEAGRKTGAAVATSLGQRHYLTGLWSTAMAEKLEEVIGAKGLRRMMDVMEIFHVAEAEWFPMPHDPFTNINTPEDLAAAETLLHD